LGGTFIDIGLDGVIVGLLRCFGGVLGAGEASTTVAVEAESEALSDSTLLDSLRVPADFFLLLGAGVAVACSALTSVLARALGGATPNPRSAKLIVRDIRGTFDVEAEAVLRAGFLGEWSFLGTGFLGAFSIFRRHSSGFTSCSRRCVIDLAEMRSCVPEA
jgi:hypothetical protein